MSSPRADAGLKPSGDEDAHMDIEHDDGDDAPVTGLSIPGKELQVAIDSDTEQDLSNIANFSEPPAGHSEDALNGNDVVSSRPESRSSPSFGLLGERENGGDSLGPTASVLSRRRHSLGPKLNFKMENRGKKRALEDSSEAENVEVDADDGDSGPSFLPEPKDVKELKEKKLKGKESSTARRHSFHMGAETAQWREFNQRMGIPKSTAAIAPTSASSRRKSVASSSTQTDSDILRKTLNIPQGEFRNLFFFLFLFFFFFFSFCSDPFP